MDVKEAKEFSIDTSYGISEMISLIKAQKQEIEDLKDQLLEAKIIINQRSEPL